MKFVKENMTLVICGAVAVLFLVFALAPIPAVSIPAWNDDLVEKMKGRWDEQSRQVKTWANKEISLPNGPTTKGIPPASWVDAKQKLITSMVRMQGEVEKDAKVYNAQGRLDRQNLPMLPILGKSMPGLLPHASQDAIKMAFKEDYNSQFPRWIGLLATGQAAETTSEAAMPPKIDDLKKEWDALVAADLARKPPGAGGGSSAPTGQQTKAERDFYKKMVVNRAMGLRMYVLDTAFQVRDWGVSAPEDSQIFEGFVDSWLQTDVVKAIATVNNTALSPMRSTDKNVGQAPIKRLTRIVIGNNARNKYLTVGSSVTGGGPQAPATGGNALFFTSANANVAAPGSASPSAPLVPVNGAPPAAGAKLTLPETANQNNYELGMTGRSAGRSYDIVYMSVVMDIDPAYLFKFMEQLYKQNMCYTLTNMQMKTVDPLDRASQGFIYGETQVIEVEFLVECVFFRSWTEPLMPDRIKQDLGAK
jgi:hypothetical protein